MNRPKLIELTNNSSVEDLANIFDELLNEFDWLMQYIVDALGIEEIEQGEDEDDEEYEARIAGTPYGICYSFTKKCTPQNTAEIIQLAIKNDRVAEFWDLFLGEEHISDYGDFVDLFNIDTYGAQKFTDTQLKIVEEAIKYIREDI